MTQRISVRGLAVVDGKVLAVQLKPYNKFVRQVEPFWCLPGGGVDEGEALLVAVAREMLEETGVPAQVGRLLYVQQFEFAGTHNLECIFHIENAADYLHIDLSKTTHGLEEIAEIGFIEPTSVNLLPEFLKTEDLTGFIASTEAVRFFSR